MAHGDYCCCAICNKKMEYDASDDVKRKTEICLPCLKTLREEKIELNGKLVLDGGEFIEWLNAQEPKIIVEKLNRIHFKICKHYHNDVDKAVETKLGKSYCEENIEKT